MVSADARIHILGSVGAWPREAAVADRPAGTAGSPVAETPFPSWRSPGTRGLSLSPMCPMLAPDGAGGTMLFLRHTRDPEGDILRGWSGHACCWYATEAEALAHRARNHTGEPRRDPVSGAWNADPETGLSGYGFDGEASFGRAMLHARGYAEAEGVEVFESSDYDLGAGADGEDCFRDARHLGRIGHGAAWEDVEALMAAAPGPAT